jgi:hypothetical protein
VTTTPTRQAIAAALFLLAILLVVFHDALSPGMVLSPADALFITPAFDDLKPADFTKPANPLLFDQVYQFTPWRYFSWHSVRDGALPLWNPYSYSGTPFMATMHTAVFYPINLVLTLLPFEATFVVSAILRLWLAGLFTYALARRYDLRPIPSLIAAVSFMLCAFNITWLGHPHTNVSVWLPATLLFVECITTEPDRRRQVRYAVLAALVIAVELTGGHIETTVDVLFAAGLYAVFRLILPHADPAPRRGRTVLLLLGAPVLGAACAAIQVLPFLEWLPLSAEYARRSVSDFASFDAASIRHTLSLATLVFPNIYNNPTWDGLYWSFLLNWRNYNELTVYVGVLTLLLAIIGVVAPMPRRRLIIYTWMAVIVLALGRALHYPLFNLLNELPGLALGTAGRLRFVASFGCCVLAAFGADTLLDRAARSATRRTWVLLCGAVLASGALLLIATSVLLPRYRQDIVAHGIQVAEEEYARRSTHSHPIEYYHRQVEEMVDALISAFRPTHLPMYLPCVWAALGLLTVIALPQRAAAVAMLGLVTADLVTFATGYNPAIPSSEFYPPHSAVAAINHDAGLFRTTALRQDLLPDVHMMYGASDVRGLDFPTRWYDEYMHAVPDRIDWLTYGAIIESATSPLLTVLNLKYVIAADRQSLLDDPEIATVAPAGSVQIGTRRSVHARAFMVYESVVADDDVAALAFLRDDPAAVFRRVVLVAGDGAERPATPHAAPAAPPAHDVQLLSYGAHEASWRVATDREGFLVVGDSYYPGWQAFLDGRRVDLHRANVAFRAVAVPPGTHDVVLRFRPTSVALGAALSGVGLLACGALLIATRARHARVSR